MEGFNGFWYETLNSVQGVFAGLIAAIGIAVIIAVIIISVLKTRNADGNEKNVITAIFVSTFLCCILMVPVISSFNNLFSSRIKEAVKKSMLDEAQAELRVEIAATERIKAEIAMTRAKTSSAKREIVALKREIRENKIEMTKQSLEISMLKDNIRLLEGSQLNMMSFEQIMELALQKVNFKYNLIKKEPLPPIDPDWRNLAKYSQDEVLIITSYDIEAKLGVDLEEVRISKIDADSVVISGIKQKPIGISKMDSHRVLWEYRKNDYVFGRLNGVSVLRSPPHYIETARARADEYEKEYKAGLDSGASLNFLESAAIRSAENFIRIILKPLYNDVSFDYSGIKKPDALPIMEHLKNELKNSNKKLFDLLNADEEIILIRDQLEA